MSAGPGHLHASCVVAEGRGVLILGPSGSGKSSLAVAMMALGAELVSDDQVLLEVRDGALMARPPATIAGLLEMRGIGLVRVRHAPETRVVLVADLALKGVSRMPRPEKTCIAGVWLPLIAGRERPNLAAELMVCLRQGLDPLFPDREGTAESGPRRV